MALDQGDGHGASPFLVSKILETNMLLFLSGMTGNLL